MQEWQHRPLDRIFWLTGVRNYTGATQAFLVRKGTKWNIKDFAKECGVQILDMARVAEIEAALKIGEDEWPGVSERAFYETNIASWNKALNAESRYWELYQTLTSEIRFDDAFVGVNYLLSQLRQMTRQWSKVPEESYFRFLLSESIAQMAVFPDAHRRGVLRSERGRSARLHQEGNYLWQSGAAVRRPHPEQRVQHDAPGGAALYA